MSFISAALVGAPSGGFEISDTLIQTQNGPELLLDPFFRYQVDTLELSSGLTRASMNDRADVLATQGSGESSRNKAIHNLHPLYMTRSRHDLGQSRIDRQRALELCKIGDAHLAKQFRRLSFGAVGVRSRPPSTSSTIVSRPRPARRLTETRRYPPGAAEYESLETRDGDTEERRFRPRHGPR